MPCLNIIKAHSKDAEPLSGGVGGPAFLGSEAKKTDNF